MKHPGWVRVVPLLAALVGICGGPTVEAQTTQKQWQLVKSGAQGYTLKMAEVPVPKPAAGEVLIRMHAASLNRRDVFVMRGQYPMPPRGSLVPLSDGAGEVVAVGANAKRFKVGDKVSPIFFPRWVNGRATAQNTEVSLGGAVDGVLTQYMAIDEQSVVAIPPGYSYEEAATLPCAAVTAWNGLVTRGRMQAGDYVLLEGTGGVSIFGLQIALASGAKPIITSSSDEKLARAKALGAVGGVNYKTTPDWEKPVRELTNGAGVQQILEVGGKDSLPHALASLSPGGHIALIGGLGGFGGEIPVMPLLGGNITVSGIYVGSRENFEALTAFLAKHPLKPVIDKVIDFKDAPAAYQHMEKESFLGKIVIANF
ncbi:MAG TPA: NAD(P)-dependent alcohol dehydrogenase [Steroidobacteraceae bacterium]|nr:NAD(P)-dependent alcohol dehydrogenase [Steroidobacteraceae bacterium]